jgi:N-acetylglucosamine transport system permease protein
VRASGVIVHRLLGGIRLNKRKGRGRFIFFCLAPALILYTIFMIYPTVKVFEMSLYKWTGFVGEKTFVGINNFIILLEDDYFLRSLQNSILLIVVVTVFTISLSLTFAGILTREKIKGQSIFRIIFYIPNILSIVVISAIFSAIYDPANGLLNSFLALFKPGDAEPVYWLGDQKIVIYSIIIAMIWQAVGYYMVMYMASMSAVPVSLYECADLEGASHIKQFFSITLPLIWTNIRTTLTFFIISTINLSFMIVKAMTDGGPDGSTEVFLSYMYKQAYTNSSYGYGMAIGVVVFAFSFALSGIVNGVTKRENLEY